MPATGIGKKVSGPHNEHRPEKKFETRGGKKRKQTAGGYPTEILSPGMTELWKNTFLGGKGKRMKLKMRRFSLKQQKKEKNGGKEGRERLTKSPADVQEQQ